MTDQEGLISLLEDCRPLTPVKQPASVPVKRTVGSQELQTVTDADWQVLPTAEKWDKIRSAWMNGKTAEEIAVTAQEISVLAWLDVCVKMAPKDVKVQGTVSFKHMIDSLAPINKDDYRLGAVEVEFSEVK